MVTCSLCLILVACGTPTPPTTLGTNLSATEAFFADQHAGHWAITDSDTFFNDLGNFGRRSKYASCFVEIYGPRRSDQVNLVSLGCSYPETAIRNTRALFDSVAQEYAPPASTWLRRILAQTISGPNDVNDQRTFGEVSFTYGIFHTCPMHRCIAPDSESVGLQVYASGFHFSTSA